MFYIYFYLKWFNQYVLESFLIKSITYSNVCKLSKTLSSNMVVNSLSTAVNNATRSKLSKPKSF